ncbi:MAG: MerR family transcriptional regulator [Cumulibacter sp.]
MTDVRRSDDDAEVMHIGEVAARTELSIRSLRHWDEVGLIRPSGRTDGGFRLYTQADIDKIMTIRRMKPLGFTLEQMTVTMRDIEALHEPRAGQAPARERLTAVLADAEQRRAKLERQLGMADEFLSRLSHQLTN